MAINIDELRQASQSRRVDPSDNIGWECKHCNKTFKNETIFLKHMCTKMIRSEELRSPEGQAAYAYYSEWMKLNKYKAPSIETFSTSRYYQAFVKFNVHCQRVSLPSPSSFMKMMVEKEISPTLWMRDQIYGIYLDWLDKTSDPYEQIKDTVSTIMKVCEAGDIEPRNIFTIL